MFSLVSPDMILHCGAITECWGDAVYRCNIEDLPRLASRSAPFLSWLRENCQIELHISVDGKWNNTLHVSNY